MNIYGVTTVRNEAPIIAKTISHLLGEGIDRIYVSDGNSTDGTQEVLASLPNTHLIPQQLPFDQGEEIAHLSLIAFNDGADWIIPFDADEFWVPDTGQKPTIREVLEDLNPIYSRIYCPQFLHLDWSRKVLPAKPLGKVMFRPHPDMNVHWGNHLVDNIPGEEIHGIIQIRELQYRDRAHVSAKAVRERLLRSEVEIDPAIGAHLKILAESSAEALDAFWSRLQALPAVDDPIPYKGAL